MTVQLSRLATVVFTIALFGCIPITSGRKFDVSVIPQLQQGVSTPAQVENLLGTPYTKRRNIDGSEHWTWVYTESNIPLSRFMKTKTDRTELLIIFNNDTMSRCWFLTSTKKARGDRYGSITRSGLGEGSESTINCSELRGIETSSALLSDKSSTGIPSCLEETYAYSGLVLDIEKISLKESIMNFNTEMKPQDSYLVFDIALKNMSNRPVSLQVQQFPIFYLMDGDIEYKALKRPGNTHDISMAIMTGQHSQVNPNREIKGETVFDVPKGKNYRPRSWDRPL